MTIKYAIIVAGGNGTRFGSSVPKQFLGLNGTPILMHTINAFYKADATTKIVVVLPENQISLWNELCKNYNFKTPHQIVIGGDSRFNSVKNALKSLQGSIENNDLIAIHDGVRPLISNSLINSLYDKAEEVSYGVIPVVPVTDSIRKIESDNKSVAVDRSQLRSVQTPQIFKASVLIDAYQQPEKKEFTDDASVVEANGGVITLGEGDPTNIKITNPLDIKIAEAILKYGATL